MYKQESSAVLHNYSGKKIWNPVNHSALQFTGEHLTCAIFLSNQLCCGETPLYLMTETLCLQQISLKGDDGWRQKLLGESDSSVFSPSGWRRHEAVIFIHSNTCSSPSLITQFTPACSGPLLCWICILIFWQFLSSKYASPVQHLCPWIINSHSVCVVIVVKALSLAYIKEQMQENSQPTLYKDNNWSTNWITLFV